MKFNLGTHCLIVKTYTWKNRNESNLYVYDKNKKKMKLRYMLCYIDLCFEQLKYKNHFNIKIQITYLTTSKA